MATFAARRGLRALPAVRLRSSKREYFGEFSPQPAPIRWEGVAEGRVSVSENLRKLRKLLCIVEQRLIIARDICLYWAARKSNFTVSMAL